MKLKKFAAMMLAGVMAVSMLAGCSGKGTNGGNGDDGVVESGSSSIVTAFNDGQDEDNDIKVTFTSDSKLDTLLASAVKAAGSENGSANQSKSAVLNLIKKLTGKDGEEFFTEADEANKDIKDGMTRTEMTLERYTSAEFWSEEDAVNKAARDLDDKVADLLEDTKDGKKDGDKYFEFSYAGNVSLVTIEKVDGHSVYYVLYTITQTATEKTVASK